MARHLETISNPKYNCNQCGEQDKNLSGVHMSLCYFCNSQCTPYNGNTQPWFCHSCTKKNDLKAVYTTGPFSSPDDDGSPIFHIYLLLPSSHYDHNEYQIRYYTGENRTDILCNTTGKTILDNIEGFIFTPANAKEKLKMLLPFI